MLHTEGSAKPTATSSPSRGVALDVAPGEIACLRGPNGAGKTTLVPIVAGLRRPDAGVVEVDGLDATTRSVEARRRIGEAPQDHGQTFSS